MVGVALYLGTSLTEVAGGAEVIEQGHDKLKEGSSAGGQVVREPKHLFTLLFELRRLFKYYYCYCYFACCESEIPFTILLLLLLSYSLHIGV